MKKELAPESALLGLLTQKPKHGYELYRYFTDPSASLYTFARAG